MKNFILFIWQLLFDRWEVEILEEGEEVWMRRRFVDSREVHKNEFARQFVKYKYKHRFFKKEKIVKEYLN